MRKNAMVCSIQLAMLGMAAPVLALAQNADDSQPKQLDAVQVTLYSADPDTHNTLVGAPGFADTTEGIRHALEEQLYKPVLWAETVRAMLARGVTTVIECGPGKVLTSLNRRIERRSDLTMLALEDPPSLAAALEACREKPHAAE